MLRELLRQDSCLNVHCLVRAEDEANGFERIRAALVEAEVWEESFATRMRIVVGDICQERLGLSGSDFDSLSHRLDAVYHLAVDVNLTSSYSAIRKINVLGFFSILELCLSARFKHLFFASTMSVFPQYFFGFANEFKGCAIGHQMQPDLTEMKKKFPVAMLGYPWSKLVAEQVLLHADAAGMPVAIFRLPRTSTASTGMAKADDVGSRLVAAVADVGMQPRGFSTRRIGEPADALSRIFVAISRNSRRRFKVYHCCDPRPTLHDAEPSDFGRYWPEVSYSTFKRACQARGKSSPLQGQLAILDYFAPYWFGIKDVGAALPICDRAMRADCPHPIKWPGLLTVVARYGEWVERHRSQWPFPIANSRLDLGNLMDCAESYARHADVASDLAYPAWMRENLERLVSALSAPDSRLLERRRDFLVFDLNRLLRNNALLAREWQQNPDIERVKCARPVFIIGINRTGTTFLHRLMAQDQRFWTLRGYEYFQPVRNDYRYVESDGKVLDFRREALEDMIEALRAEENFGGIHGFGIDEPEEDFPLLRLAFACWTLAIQFGLPEYERWLTDCGSRNAYAHHRRIVQYFAHRRRLDRAENQGQWLFKMPFHLKELESLVSTYPDALFIQTHREPNRFMGSWNSLVKRVRSYGVEPQPPEQMGAEQLAFMSGMLNGATRFRSSHPELEDRWVDVAYADLVRNPMEAVRGIYERFGWPITSSAAREMENWLSRQEERRRSMTLHSYRLEDFGLSREEVDLAFATYLEFASAQGVLRRNFSASS